MDRESKILKRFKQNGYGKIILTNTCVFDTAVFVISVATCDGHTYLMEVNKLQINSTFTTFVN